MLTIKKVQVVPLDVNEGKIIDSFDTQDDQTKNAPSARATKDYIDTKYQVLSGTTAPTNDLGKDGDIYLQHS